MKNKMNDFVGNILQNKVYAYGYILLSRTCRRCTLICGAGMLLATGAETSLLLNCRGGQLFLLLKGHFEKAAFSGGPCLLIRVEAVSVYSLSTNICYDYEKLQELSDLKIFLNASAGHWKRCVGPHLARGQRTF